MSHLEAPGTKNIKIDPRASTGISQPRKVTRARGPGRGLSEKGRDLVPYRTTAAVNGDGRGLEDVVLGLVRVTEALKGHDRAPRKDQEKQGQGRDRAPEAVTTRPLRGQTGHHILDATGIVKSHIVIRAKKIFDLKELAKVV